MTGDRFDAWRRSLSDGDLWAHCGNSMPHFAHTHTIVFNEGPYPGSVCVGTPVFELKDRAQQADERDILDRLRDYDPDIDGTDVIDKAIDEITELRYRLGMTAG